MVSTAVIAIDNPVLLAHPDELEALGSSALPWPYRPEDVTRHAADQHWVWFDGDHTPAARCSIWWHGTPPFPGHRVGLIGHYAALDAEAGQNLLTHASRELARRGATLAVGPMDGSTWRQYRLVAERGTEPAFFLEPDHPAEWLEHWSAAGFRPVAHYHSRLVSNLSFEDPRGPEASQRLSALDVRLRPLALQNLELELKRLYPVIVSSFRSSPFFSPISEEAFVGQYLALRSHLRPELITLAEHEDQLVGVLFAVPDLLQSVRGQEIDTIIIKTLAISPLRAYAGLGSYLASETHRQSRKLGYQRVIHALMHDSSKSQSISARYGQIMRRYALLAKAL
jgi:hypothetical protein